MSTDNICLFKEVARKYTCCNLKTTELLNCALIGVCVVIRSNTVVFIIANICLIEIPVVNANSVDPNQMPYSVSTVCQLLFSRSPD